MCSGDLLTRSSGSNNGRGYVLVVRTASVGDGVSAATVNAGGSDIFWFGTVFGWVRRRVLYVPRRVSSVL